MPQCFLRVHTNQTRNGKRQHRMRKATHSLHIPASTARIKHEGRKEEGEGDGECILASGGREVPVATHHTPQILVCPHHARDRATSYGKQQQSSHSPILVFSPTKQTTKMADKERVKQLTATLMGGLSFLISIECACV